MRRAIHVVLLLIGLTAGLAAQLDEDAAWNAFTAWFRTTAAAGNPLAGYAAKLRKDGKASAEIDREIRMLTTLMAERSDWIAIYYDKVFARPSTGDPVVDGFSSHPSRLLVDAIAGVEPGAALDVGMGQGRNAVFLAQQGWTVTGFDISSEAVTASRANATKAGVNLTAITGSYDAFDYGIERWDLVVLTFAWAPLDDPAFVARLQRSLRPGGRVVVEHFVHLAVQAGPNLMHKLVPNELRRHFDGFEIRLYEEAEGLGDWGGPGSQLVRMIAVKPLTTASGGGRKS